MSSAEMTAEMSKSVQTVRRKLKNCGVHHDNLDLVVEVLTRVPGHDTEFVLGIIANHLEEPLQTYQQLHS